MNIIGYMFLFSAWLLKIWHLALLEEKKGDMITLL